MATQAQIDKAVATALAIANDDSHGYSNVVGDNNGSNGDYDCGGFVSKSYQEAGILAKGVMFEPNERYGNSWSYGTVLEPVGFVQMPFDYNAVKKGDILIKDGHHTELAIGNYQQVGAHDNYDGVRGDYNHKGEIAVVPLTQNYWDYIYRLPVEDEKYSSTHKVVSEYINGMSNAKVEKAFKSIFNATYFKNKYPNVANTYGTDTHTLLQYFLNEGMAGNMQGASTFDPTYFEQNNADLVAQYGTNYPNYYIWCLMNNKKEKRRTYLSTDVPADSKYYKYVKYCTDKGLFKLKTIFGINDRLTRLEMALILYRLAGKPSVGTGTLPYSDVGSLTTFQKKAIYFCYKNGYITGYKDGTFRPDKDVTKQAVALYLYKYKDKPVVTGSVKYADITAKKGSATYDAILWAIKNKIMKGKSGKFKPKAAIKKYLMAIYLYRFLGGK